MTPGAVDAEDQLRLTLGTMRRPDRHPHIGGHPRRIGWRHPVAPVADLPADLLADVPAGCGRRRLLREGDLSSTLRLIAPAMEARAVLVAPAGGPPADEGWVSCAELASAERLDAVLASIRQTQDCSAEVAASYYLGWYAANVVAPAVAAFVVARRVPDLAPAQMSLRHCDGGWFDMTAFHRGDMTVLADDPALTPAPAPALTLAPALAASPEPAPALAPALAAARPVVDGADDDGALLERLAGGLVGHLEPLVDALRARVRLGPPALWGTVAAQCARAFLLTERITRDPHVGHREADAFFAAASPPLRARPTWQQFVHHGRHHTGMRRGSCCLAHRATSVYCTTCPFTSDVERERRLRDWIDTQGDDGLAV